MNMDAWRVTLMALGYTWVLGAVVFIPLAVLLVYVRQHISRD
jgi:hypothetical protein